MTGVQTCALPIYHVDDESDPHFFAQGGPVASAFEIFDDAQQVMGIEVFVATAATKARRLGRRARGAGWGFSDGHSRTLGLPAYA